MLWAILLVAIANVPLGWFLALWLEKRLVPRPPPVFPLDENLADDLADAPAEENTAEPAPPPVSHAPIDLLDGDPPVALQDIPKEWLRLLEAEGIKANSFVEASAHVLRLEVGMYRRKLISLENHWRKPGLSPDLLISGVAQLAKLNREWRARQSEAAGYLSGDQGKLPVYEDLGRELECVTRRQVEEIDAIMARVAAVDPAARDAAPRLFAELARFIELAHALRDCMYEALTAVMRAENCFESLDRRNQLDVLTQVYNRTGLEVLLHDWRRNDPQRSRFASLVMIGMDGFRETNRAHGAWRGDQLLTAVAGVLSNLIRKDRGFDRAARFASDVFVLFLGDTGPRNATSAAERFRQTLQACTFEWPGQEVELTFSMGVVELGRDESAEAVLGRLRAALSHAKETRGCTALDEGGGPKAVMPPQFQVTGRVVRVGG